MATAHYYEVLELTKDAKPIDIKKAYRRLALKHHPDRNGGSAESTEKFKLIGEAYSVLSNPESRRNYDNELKRPPSAASPCRSSSSRTTTYYRDPFSQFEDLFRNDPFFHDAFEGMDDAFAARFSQPRHNEQEDDGGIWAFFRCGDENSKEKKQSFGEWVLKKLGIELTVTSYSTQADGSTMKSTYTSNRRTGSTSKQSRTYVDKQGRQVTVMSMEKNGNEMEDKFIAGKLVQRKVNGVVEPLLSTEVNAKESRDTKETRDNTQVTASTSSNSTNRID